MIGRLRVTPRGIAGRAVRFGVPFGALVVALLIGAVLLALSGSDPLEAYRTMFDASLNGWNPLTRTLALATPLILTGLAAAVAFQMRVYNIGGGHPVELLRYIEVIEETVGRKAKLEMLPMQPGDVPDTCAAVEALMNDVGYRPSTTVEEGIPRFVEWYRDYYGV